MSIDEQDEVQNVNGMFAEATAAMRLLGLSTLDASSAFLRLKEVVADLEPIDMREIARMRMRMLWNDHGPACVFVVAWWRWLLIKVTA